MRSTIYALASAAGKAGVAVFRISGPSSSLVLTHLTGLPVDKFKPRCLTLHLLRCPISNDAIDRAMLVHFPAPNTFTGEPVVEIHSHAGSAVIRKILDTLGSLPDLRIAERGEFSRRAFENGKLDLLQVEGLASLIEAETEAQRKFALDQLEGRQGKLIGSWSDQIREAVATIEALIDFSEEDEIASIESLKAKVRVLQSEIGHHLQESERRESILKGGLQVAIAGAPNSGKSSLMNWMCNRKVSIVSPWEGTTRDVLEGRLEVDGFPVHLYDTAGIREAAADPIEREGIESAISLFRRVDLIFYLIDGSNPKLPLLEDTQTPVVYFISKSDIADRQLVERNFPNLSLTPISVKEEIGMDAIQRTLSDWIKKSFSCSSQMICNHRQRELVREAFDCIGLFLSCRISDYSILGEYLRRALESIGLLTGRVSPNQLLDSIFKNFCIGK